jgi:hypothetical protein
MTAMSVFMRPSIPTAPMRVNRRRPHPPSPGGWSVDAFSACPAPLVREEHPPSGIVPRRGEQTLAGGGHLAPGLWFASPPVAQMCTRSAAIHGGFVLEPRQLGQCVRSPSKPPFAEPPVAIGLQRLCCLEASRGPGPPWPRPRWGAGPAPHPGAASLPGKTKAEAKPAPPKEGASPLGCSRCVAGRRSVLAGGSRSRTVRKGNSWREFLSRAAFRPLQGAEPPVTALMGRFRRR